MRRRPGIAVSVLVAGAGLSGCVTPRVYSEAELSTLVRRCGLAEGELVQEPDEPRLLFLMSPAATPPQRYCVARWSKRHGLHLSYVVGIDRVQN